jgi:transposase
MLHPKMKWTYVGIDSHKDTHCAVFLDCFFGRIGEITFNNIPSEFEAFLKEARKFRVHGTAFAFGLEDFSAYGRSLSVFLTGKNQMVKHVNAALVASERKSGNILQKTDSFDAECAARVLLSRFDSLPICDPQDKYFILGNLVARRNSIVKINHALKNHLHSLLTDNYPSYKKFFPSIATKTALMFFEKYPSPLALNGITAEELAEPFKSITGSRFTVARATELLTHISKCGFTPSEYQMEKDFTVMSTVRQIRANLYEIEEVDKMLANFLKKFDYKLTSMKGIDTVIASKLIAEIGDIKRFESPSKLAKYAGIAPVTYASGKSDCQFANARGNRNLNEIFFRLALTLTMTSGGGSKITNHYFYDYYRKKLSEGKTKKQALKCVQRRVVNIIFGMMKNNTEYINPPICEKPKDETEKQKSA